ncbi:MAG: hypothetical protein ACRELD_05585 [Longimicrobiales bacterium]
MRATSLFGPTLHALRPRLLALLALAAVFLFVALSAALFLRDEAGHVEIGQLFLIGGYPLASAVLLLGWLLSRFPMIAALVLLAGFFSADHERGHARLIATRPVSLTGVYGARLLLLIGLAFLISALLLPLFDLLMLGGHWAGPVVFVIIAGQILVYGSLCALLSIWTRGDAWITLLIAIIAITWDAVLRVGSVYVPPGARAFVGTLLPPQSAMFRLEGAYSATQAIPWDAFAFVVAWSFVVLLLAAASLRLREL